MFACLERLLNMPITIQFWTRRLIGILAIATVTPVFGKTLLLECAVSGEVSLVHSSEYASKTDGPPTKLDAASIQIQIDDTDKALFIEIDGPSAYAVTLSSVPRANTTVITAKSNADSYSLITKRQTDPVSYEDNVFINRKSGAIMVRKTSVNPSYREETTYNGTCNKVNRSTDKF